MKRWQWETRSAVGKKMNELLLRILERFNISEGGGDMTVESQPKCR